MIYQMTFENLILAITLVAVGTAAIRDIKKKVIPNIITYPLIAGGLILNTVLFGLEGFKNSVFGLLILIAILFIPFAFGWLGAGDVKLYAGIAAFNGMWFGIFTLLYSSLVGGVIALIIVISRGELGLTLINLSSSLLNVKMNLLEGKLPQSDDISTTGIKFPYGLAIFMGTVVTYLLR